MKRIGNGMESSSFITCFYYSLKLVSALRAYWDYPEINEEKKNVKEGNIKEEKQFEQFLSIILLGFGIFV